mgnify:CR=1 FL=1
MSRFQALFDPRGIVVAGASSHPGKFGFVTLHNILSQGYAGGVYATNRDGGTILGIDTVAGIDDLPADAIVDLVFVCTPAAANPDLLRACARRGECAALARRLAGLLLAQDRAREAADALLAARAAGASGAGFAECLDGALAAAGDHGARAALCRNAARSRAVSAPSMSPP